MIIASVVSCTPGKRPGIGEVKDENYRIQVSLMEIPKRNDSSCRYKIRIWPGQKVLEEGGINIRETLWYRTDSCFSVVHDDLIIEPALVQPIANGLGNCYEYMLVFDGLPVLRDNENIAVVFHDRHITKQKYLIELFQ